MNELNALARPAAEIELVEFPIPPGQILGGNPTARIWISAQAADGKVTQGVWDCTAGQFRWSYTWDEFILILEGEVTIESSGKKKTTLRAGDHAHFPLGLQATWTVPKYVKKTFVLRTPLKI